MTVFGALRMGFLAAACIAAMGASAGDRPLAGAKNPKHIECAKEAARYWDLPFLTVLTLLSVEGGWEGAEVANAPRSDGTVTYDLGPMQINDSAWASFFAEVGISREMLRDDACVNIHAGTWIVRSHYEDILRERARNGESPVGALKEAMLRYHTRTPDIQERYAERMREVLERGVRISG